MGAAKRAVLSFPHRQGDARGKAETRDETRSCSFPQRHGDATGKPETRDQTRGRSKTRHFVRDLLQFWHLRHVIKQVGMSQNATPATQNDMTSCVETIEKERFCSFPHRHGINDATPTRRRPPDTTWRRRDADSTSNSRRTRVQPPDPQTINGNPSLRIRE